MTHSSTDNTLRTCANALLLAIGVLCTVGLVASQEANAQSVNSRHAPVSAHDAQAAVSRGAVVLDVRSADAFSLGSLPNAVSLPDLEEQPIESLSSQLSRAGVDLSREVLLVGDAGSPEVQRLHETLSRRSSGRVLWLVGGLAEWQATGGAIVAQTAAKARYPVPQHLVSLPANGIALEPSRGAAPQRRESTVKPILLADLYGFARLY